MTADPWPAEPVDILLVEDNPDDVELTREALSSAKLANNLHVARTAEQAVAWLEDMDEPRPSLMLLDINLPGMSGLELLEKVKTTERWKTIPIVILTTSRAPEDISEAYSSHASAFISKPVDFTEFVEAVQTLGGFYLALVELPDGKRPRQEGRPER